MTVVWTDALSVQVKEIDEQHKEFIKIMNSLYTGISAPDLKMEIDHILDQLINYAGYHFATEEKYFDEFKYPDAADHKQKHQEMTATILGFKKSGKDSATLAMELMSFLEKWLLEHLSVYDKKYTEFFHQHGLF